MLEQIVDSYVSTFGDGPQAAKERIKLAAAVAEVDRLVPAEPAADQNVDRDGLQSDYDRYLAMLGADHAIVVSLRKQIEAGAAPESQTAVAVK